MTKQEFITLIKKYNEVRLAAFEAFMVGPHQEGASELPLVDLVLNLKDAYRGFLEAGQAFFYETYDDAGLVSEAKMRVHAGNVLRMKSANNELFFDKIEAAHDAAEQCLEGKNTFIMLRLKEHCLTASRDLHFKMMAFYETSKTDYAVTKAAFDTARMLYTYHLRTYAQCLVHDLRDTNAEYPMVGSPINEYVRLLDCFYLGVHKELKVVPILSDMSMRETCHDTLERQYKEKHPVISFGLQSIKMMVSTAKRMGNAMIRSKNTPLPAVQADPQTQVSTVDVAIDILALEANAMTPDPDFLGQNPYFGLMLQSASRASSPSREEEVKALLKDEPRLHPMAFSVPLPY